MVNYTAATLDTVFSALADPTRRAILERLASGEASVTELAQPFADSMSLPAISRHLRVLESAGLIGREKEGRVHHLHLRAEALKDAAAWLAYYGRFWNEQFDSLEDYLAQADPEIPDEE